MSPASCYLRSLDAQFGIPYLRSAGFDTDMDIALSPMHLKHITYADKDKIKVLGLGRVAISKDRHMDRAMLVDP